MSAKLPLVDSKTLINFFKSKGFAERGQHGSHLILKKAGYRPLVVPHPEKVVPTGIVLDNLRTALIPRADFMAFVQRKSKGRRKQSPLE